MMLNAVLVGQQTVDCVQNPIQVECTGGASITPAPSPYLPRPCSSRLGINHPCPFSLSSSPLFLFRPPRSPSPWFDGVIGVLGCLAGFGGGPKSTGGPMGTRSTPPPRSFIDLWSVNLEKESRGLGGGGQRGRVEVGGGAKVEHPQL